MLGTLTLNFAPGTKLCPLVKQVLGNFHERSSVYYSLSVDFSVIINNRKGFPSRDLPVQINTGNTRTMCELYEKLTIKIPDWSQ